MDFALFRQELYEGGQEPVFMVSWNSYPAFDAAFAYVQYRCDKPQASIYWCAKSWDSLYQASLMEMNPTKREQLFQQAGAIMREEAPYIFLYQNAGIYGVRDIVMNYKARPNNIA